VDRSRISASTEEGQNAPESRQGVILSQRRLPPAVSNLAPLARFPLQHLAQGSFSRNEGKLRDSANRASRRRSENARETVCWSEDIRFVIGCTVGGRSG
jgi:hypothetical protein